MTTPREKELCRGVIKVLRSEKNKKYSSMFTNPFPLEQVPGYLDVCPKVMDIWTLSDNLEKDKYLTREDFFQDCLLIFENAIKYHSDKDATKWLVAPAKQMLKICKREQQKVEKKMAQDDLTTAANNKITKESGGGPKIKLKLGGSFSATAAAPKPKIKIKQEPIVSQGKTPPTGVDTGASATATSSGQSPTKKPRITLKLGSKSSSNLASGSTPKSTTSSGSTSSKILLKVAAAAAGGGGGGVSRGKELPKGIAPPETKVKPEPKTIADTTTAKKDNAKKPPAKTVTTKKTMAKLPGKIAPGKVVAGKLAAAAATKKDKPPAKTKITLKPSNKLTSKDKVPQGIGVAIQMTSARRAQCAKVLNGLRRRQAKNIPWFDRPVSDKKIIQDYRAKIKHPMDLSTMQSKLDGGAYHNVACFALDLRRIFGNCLQFNTAIVMDSLRPIAVETFETAEQLLMYFVAKPDHPQPTYSPLLFCWKLCLSLLDTLYNLINPDDKMPIAHFFMFPVSYYFGGYLPPEYPPKPMDFGTITAKLVEGYYTSVDQFESDCKLVIENCLKFNENNPENKRLCEQAQRLNETMQQQLDNLNRYIKSSSGQAAQKTAQLAISTSTLPKPPIPLLLNILGEMRNLKYTDKMTKITEVAMANFEKPVSVAVLPDYMSIIPTPMDLQTVERKIKNGQYATPEDFEFDMILIFQNCITYYTQRKTDHLVALGKFGLKNFRRVFNAMMKIFDDPLAAPALKLPPIDAATRKDPPIGDADQGPSKKQKTDISDVSRPRITLSVVTISEAQKAAQSQGRKSPKVPTSPSTLKLKPNQPVPLHIAIAKVKERFPLRRNVKSLQSWEAACARFFKELMKHPWISAARPKFIFHVPVPILFPALKEAYAAKIRKPMDLTTVECTLLAGNRYAAPEDFVNDVALVFSNAITFNKDGRDVGDPLSCAYYDASIHLLRYTRWLSLESLLEFVQDSEHVDEPETIGLPLSSWKLTTGNKQKARSEMEAIVLKEPIEKSLEGDKYTWTETECEKLLRSLRYQADYRHMSFFLAPNYPPDYTAFISRPMDWEKVQKTLKKRQYDTIGDVIDDLRLIFKNALKYNVRHSGTDTVSGWAYDAAKIMSAKLEVAINKCIIVVSDRVERERIDHSNAEREIEAAERAEEAKIREQWKNEGKDPEIAGAASISIEGSQRIRSAKRIILRRKSETDFEVPFFDEEDDGQHERSYFEVMKHQKSMFERQRAELIRMRFSAGKIGQSIFSRMMQGQLALQWVADEQKKLGMTVSLPQLKDSEGKGGTASKNNNASSAPAVASSVLEKLNAKDRAPLKISLVSSMTKRGGRKKQQGADAVGSAGMGWGSDDDADGEEA